MKKLIYLLVIVSAAYLSSCQKDLAVDPETKVPAGSTAVTPTPPLAPGNTTDTVMKFNGYIKIQLAKDTINKDDIVIFFTPKSSAIYVPGEDAPHFSGFGLLSLSSLSSDGIPLAVNMLPLKQQGDCVKLAVTGKIDAVYNLSLTHTDSIPSNYHVWLMDGLKKDSLDLSVHCAYKFDIVNADTTTYGSNRFSVKFRQQK